MANASEEYLHIHEHRPALGSECILPTGLLKMPSFVTRGGMRCRSNLIDLRSECVQRDFMKEDDEFLFYSPSHARMLYPVASQDEAAILVQDYLAGQCDVYVRNKNAMKETTSGASVTASDSAPVIMASYVLYCWGSQNDPQDYNYRERATSYTVTPLPDNIFGVNATFTAFARIGRNDPQRVVFSVENALQDNSIFYVGTCKGSRQIEYYSLSDETAHTVSGYSVEQTWTHLALIWNISDRLILLYVNGQLASRVPITRQDRIDFLSSLKTTHFVLGRSKKEGRWDGGWDGDITDARVYKHALDESRIRELAAQIPKPVNPNYPSLWNDRKC